MTIDQPAGDEAMELDNDVDDDNRLKVEQQ